MAGSSSFSPPGATTTIGEGGVVFYSPLAGFSLLAYEVSWSHTTTRHSRYDASGRVISPSQRPLPDNTQHSQQTNIPALGGIRTHNLSRRAAENLRLRPRVYWNRPSWQVVSWILLMNAPNFAVKLGVCQPDYNQIVSPCQGKENNFYVN